MKFQPLLLLLFFLSFPFQSSASCSSDQYYDGSTDSCQPCDSSCATCIGPLSTHCTSCSSNLTLQGNICVCESLEYYQSSSGKCQSCHNSCTSGCTDPQPSSCSACSNAQFEYLGACYDYCGADEYFSTTSLSCKACDSSCETCTGSSSSECSTCDDSKLFYQGQCLSECPSQGAFEYSSKQACGACDSSCLTCAGASDEECLTCSGNDTFVEIDSGLGSCQAPSSALEMIFLDAQVIQLGSTQNNFLIVFNSSIGDYYEEISSTLRISMDYTENQPAIDYNYLALLTRTTKALQLNIIFDGYLLSGSHVTITLNSTILTDSAQLQLKSYQFTLPLVESYTYPESTQQLINTTSKTSEVVSNINSVYSIMSSFAFQSLHAIRSELIDTMLDLFIFLNIEFPPNYIQFSEEKNNIIDVIIPNIFEAVSQGDKSCGSQDPNRSKRFCKYLSSGAFLENYGINITFLLGVFIFMLLIEAVKCVGAKRFGVKSLSLRILMTSSLSFRWNLLISEVISGYQELAFYSLVGFVSSTETKGIVIAAVVFVLLIFGLGFMVFLLRKLPKITEEMIQEKEKQQASQNEEKKIPHPFIRYNVLFKMFKPQSLSRLFLIPLLLLRSLGFSFVLVFLSSSPVLQLAYLYISTIGIIGYMLKFTPFHEKKQLFLTIMYEILLLIATGLATGLHLYNQAHMEDLDTRTNLGFAIIYAGFGMSILNLFSFGMEILEFIKKIKFKSKARKVVPMGAAKALVVNFKKEVLNLENSNKNFSMFNKKKLTGSTIVPFAESQNDGFSDFETPRVTPRTLSNCRKSVEEDKRFTFQKANQSISLDIEGHLDSTKETPKANYVDLMRKPTLKLTRDLNLETIEDEEAVTIKSKLGRSVSGSENIFSLNSISSITSKDARLKRRPLRFNTANLNMNNS